MRSRVWVIATCGVIGVAFAVANAQERYTSERQSPYETKRSKRLIEYFSSGSPKNPGPSDTIPTPMPLDGQAVKAEQKNPSVPAYRSGAATPPKRYIRTQGLSDGRSPATRSNPNQNVPPIKNYYKDLFPEENSGLSSSRRLSPSNVRNQPSTLAPLSQSGRPIYRDRNLMQTGFESQQAPLQPKGSQRTQSTLPPFAPRQLPPNAKSPSAFPEALSAPGKSRVIRADFEQRNGLKPSGTIQQINKTTSDLPPFAAPSNSSAAKKSALPILNLNPPKTLPATTPRITQPEFPLPANPRIDPTAFDDPAGVSTPVLDLLPPKRSEPRAVAVVVPNFTQENPVVTLKWISKSDVNVGQECVCELIVNNSSKVSASDVVVNAFFPSSVRITSAEPLPSASQDRLTWNFQELRAGEQHTIKIKMIPSRRGPLTTSSTVRFTGTSSNQITVEEPLLKIAMKGPSEVQVGDPATQILTISNPGTGITRNIQIEVRIPKGLKHPRGERLVMDVGSLNPRETRTVRLSLDAIAGGQHNVVVEAKADAGLRQLANARVSVIAPELAIEVQGPALRYLGRVARFTVIVTNQGQVATNNLRVMQQVPSGFKFDRADLGGKFDADTNSVNWFVGRLDAGQSKQLKVHLTATKTGSFTHLARATTEHGAEAESQLISKVEGTASLEMSIVDQKEPVKVDSNTTYEIHVKNTGTKAAVNVGMSCELPGGVKLLGAKGVTDHIAESGLVIFKSLPKLEPGKTIVYLIHARAQIEGSHRLRARLTSDSIQRPLIVEEVTKFSID